MGAAIDQAQHCALGALHEALLVGAAHQIGIAADLASASASGPIIFSDTIGRDAYLVRGTYKQRFMKGAKGTMLCLVDRRTHRAEAVEAKDWSAR